MRILELLQAHYNSLGFSAVISGGYLDIFPDSDADGFMATIYCPGRHVYLELQLPRKLVSYQGPGDIKYTSYHCSIEDPDGLAQIEAKILEQHQRLCR